MGKIEEFRPKDSEKITINLGFVDLGHIDLLVQEGFTQTAPTSSAQPSETSSIAKTMRSSNP